MKLFKSLFLVLIVCLFFTSCKKYQDIVDSDFPEQTVYLPAAVNGNSVNGLYNINQVAVPGRTFRYIADVTGQRLNIPLSVYRAGVNNNGSIPVSIIPNTDTINKLLTAGRLPVGTVLLPSNQFTLESSVTLENGEGEKSFTLGLNLPFLLANIATKYAIGISIVPQGKDPALFSTVVVFVDPLFLIPVANFTNTITARTVAFSNTSTFANVWSWNYGDGSPVSTARANPYTYANPGTYTITLTSFGALGEFNKSTVSRVVVIP